jgi:hypothetical protein
MARASEYLDIGFSLFGMTPAQPVAGGAVGAMLQTGSPLDHMKGLASCPIEFGTAGSSLTPA